jgi:hypothetical protein
LHTQLEHVIGGDSGDDIPNIKGYSRFSKEFKEKYPDKTELQMYPKRFELDKVFKSTYGVSAYNHPRYGYKMFLRSKKTLEDLLNENEIYKLNYKLNRQIALPEGIPTYISSNIINQYNTEPNKNQKELQNYFMKHKLFETISTIGLL